MQSHERREAILSQLKDSNRQPVSATALAARFGVSRQVIVGDVALLRAAGEAITATPRGYVYSVENTDSSKLYTIACRHGRDRMGEELYTIVDNGAGVVDVIVEHPLYGQISGNLQIFSRYDVDEFLRRLDASGASQLAELTAGLHLHTVSCRSPEEFQRICKILSEKGILEQPDT